MSWRCPNQVANNLQTDEPVQAARLIWNTRGGLGVGEKRRITQRDLDLAGSQTAKVRVRSDVAAEA